MENILSFIEIIRTFFLGAFSNISNNMSIDLGIKIILGYFFIIWAAFIIWVIKDITNRTTNIFVQTLSIFIILFFTPLFGLPVYLLIRPRTTLFEKYYEEEEVVESDDELEEVYHCPGCNHHVSREFRFCPKCAYELTGSCPSCHKQVHTDWAICPYCGEKDITPVKNEETPVKKEKKAKKETSEIAMNIEMDAIAHEEKAMKKEEM